MQLTISVIKIVSLYQLLILLVVAGGSLEALNVYNEKLRILVTVLQAYAT